MIACAMRPAPTVRIADWAKAFPAGTISGSVYAVPPANRLEAVQTLTHEGHRTHVDLILTTDGQHRGVTSKELVQLRAGVPRAQIDVHVILPGTGLSSTVARAVEAAIRVAIQVKAASLTLPPSARQDFGGVLQEVRAAGIPVWAEIPVGTPPVDGTAEGALVMLIEAGTKDAADPAQLRKIPALAATMPVGVDGGVTARVATQARAAGADVIVSGRALLQIIQ